MHKEFEVHKLTDTGLIVMADIAGGFDTLLTRLEEVIEPGRELAIVRTKLEEACFFAKKGAAGFYARG